MNIELKFRRIAALARITFNSLPILIWSSAGSALIVRFDDIVGITKRPDITENEPLIAIDRHAAATVPVVHTSSVHGARMWGARSLSAAASLTKRSRAASHVSFWRSSRMPMCASTAGMTDENPAVTGEMFSPPL